VTDSLSRPLFHIVNRIYYNICVVISTNFEELRMGMKYVGNFEA
jgi:hypothetical protein